MSEPEPGLEARQRLLREILEDIRATAADTGCARLSPQLLAALTRVPREAFVPSGARHLAYLNAPLGIGEGQTISQPFIVALMTELLQLPGRGARVLDVGTGSGYQAAVLAELGAEVYSVERLPALAARARARLAGLGYKVALRCADGCEGWPEHAPYQGIVVAAAAPEPPPALLEQLAPGAALVMPLGRPFASQRLVRLSIDSRGRLQERVVLPVAFVPLVHAPPPAAAQS